MWPDDETSALNAEAVTSLKLAINNLVWMHGPATMTLVEAEALALDVITEAVRRIEQGTSAGEMPPEDVAYYAAKTEPFEA